MAITKREYILVSCFLSGAAAIVSFVSLGTQYWVTSDALWTDASLGGVNTVQYGLFSGSFRQILPASVTYQLEMTCLMDVNACALLCGTAESRSDQLQKVSDDKDVSFDNSCPQVKSIYDDITFQNKFLGRATNNYDKRFINAGVWVTTIFFLVISGVAGIIAAALAVYNIATNPIQFYLSIPGLYIFNGIALGTVILVLFTWGLMFATTTIHNVAILYTLIGDMDSSGRAQLGYSYWLNILSMLLYMCSISLLYLRQYLISKEPKTQLEVEDNTDPALYLY